MATGFAIEGVMSMSLEINGQPLPPALGILRSYYIQAGFGMVAPVAKLDFSDTQHLLTGALAINDGTRIKLTLGRNGLHRAYDMQVLSKTKSLDTSMGQAFSVIAIANKPNYVFGAQSESYKGKSTDAIKQALEASGIQVDIDASTDDSMTWLNIGKSRSQFVKDILDHSYIDGQTTLLGLYDLDGVFYMVDAFKRLKSEPEYTLFSGVQAEFNTAPEKTFMTLESSPMQLSGIPNALLNYGSVRVDNRLAGDTTLNDKVTPPLIGDGLPINQENRDSVQYSRMDYAKYHDSGIGGLMASNAHQYYHDAPYINNRYKGLFTQGVSVLLDTDAQIPLLSCVTFQPYKQVGDDTILDTSQAGNYLVGGVTVIGNAHHYAERYTLYRSYVSDSGTTPVMGSKNQKPSTGKPRASAADSSSANFFDPNNAQAMAQQANKNIKAVGDLDAQSVAEVKSAFDTTIDKAQSYIDSTLDSFKKQADGMDLDWLAGKYGPTSDKLDALLNEVGSAKQSLKTCKKLTDFELNALNFTKLNLGGLIRIFDGRLDAVESLISNLEDDINALIAAGAISDSIKKPNLQSNCKELNTDHVNAAINKTFPDKCLDVAAANRLALPRLSMRKLRRKLEEQMRDLLCMMEK